MTDYNPSTGLLSAEETPFRLLSSDDLVVSENIYYRGILLDPTLQITVDDLSANVVRTDKTEEQTIQSTLNVPKLRINSGDGSTSDSNTAYFWYNNNYGGFNVNGSNLFNGTGNAINFNATAGAYFNGNLVFSGDNQDVVISKAGADGKSLRLQAGDDNTTSTHYIELIARDGQRQTYTAMRVDGVNERIDINKSLQINEDIEFNNTVAPSNTDKRMYMKTTQTTTGNPPFQITTNTYDLMFQNKNITADLVQAEANIATNTTNIATNASAIATNTGNIATNTTNIATNASAIATNTGNIATNTGNIATNTTNIATNASAIATNTTNIATNASAIATNTSNISTNTSNIATNTSNIATNTSNIATNTSNISSIQNDYVSKSATGSQGIASDIGFSGQVNIQGRKIYKSSSPNNYTISTLNYNDTAFDVRLEETSTAVGVYQNKWRGSSNSWATPTGSVKFEIDTANNQVVSQSPLSLQTTNAGIYFAGASPATTTNMLYHNSSDGNLYWNGSILGGGSSNAFVLNDTNLQTAIGGLALPELRVKDGGNYIKMTANDFVNTGSIQYYDGTASTLYNMITMYSNPNKIEFASDVFFNTPKLNLNAGGVTPTGLEIDATTPAVVYKSLEGLIVGGASGNSKHIFSVYKDASTSRVDGLVVDGVAGKVVCGMPLDVSTFGLITSNLFDVAEARMGRYGTTTTARFGNTAMPTTYNAGVFCDNAGGVEITSVIGQWCSLSDNLANRRIGILNADVYLMSDVIKLQNSGNQDRMTIDDATSTTNFHTDTINFKSGTTDVIQFDLDNNQSQLRIKGKSTSQEAGIYVESPSNTNHFGIGVSDANTETFIYASANLPLTLFGNAKRVARCINTDANYNTFRLISQDGTKQTDFNKYNNGPLVLVSNAGNNALFEDVGFISYATMNNGSGDAQLGCMYANRVQLQYFISNQTGSTGTTNRRTCFTAKGEGTNYVHKVIEIGNLQEDAVGTYRALRFVGTNAEIYGYSYDGSKTDVNVNSTFGFKVDSGNYGEQQFNQRDSASPQIYQTSGNGQNNTHWGTTGTEGFLYLSRPQFAIGVSNSYRHVFSTTGYTPPSDQRIKTPLVVRDDKFYENVVDNLEVGDYDLLGWGTKKFGFIAQDVRKVFPKAVSLEEDYICDIMKDCSFDVSSSIMTFASPITLVFDENRMNALRFKQDDRFYDYEVEVVSSTQIKLTTMRSQEKIKTGKYLCVGQRVKDFHMLNQEFLTGLNYGISKMLWKKMKQTEDQTNTINKMKEENSNLKLKMASLESKIAILTEAMLKNNLL